MSKKIKSKKDFSLPYKIIEEELERSMQAVKNFQFLLACILHQSGGQYEVREETMKFVKSRSSLDFKDRHDEPRKVYVFKVTFGDPVREEEEEEEEVS